MLCWTPALICPNLINGRHAPIDALFIIGEIGHFMVQSGPHFNIKMSSYQYRKSHSGDNIIWWPSYLHSGIAMLVRQPFNGSGPWFAGWDLPHLWDCILLTLDVIDLENAAREYSDISILYTPAQRSWRGGYTGFTLSVRLSVRPSVRLSVCPSVCRRHGFRSISQVCFGISISNFICMLMVAIGRSLLIFSDVTFKMAAWRPYWIFWFLDSNFTSALNINFKLQRHNTYVYG